MGITYFETKTAGSVVLHRPDPGAAGPGQLSWTDPIPGAAGPRFGGGVQRLSSERVAPDLMQRMSRLRVGHGAHWTI